MATGITTLTKTITLREANQGFARFIRAVESGEEFLITRNGAPVARLIPAELVHGHSALTPSQSAALARTRARMARSWPIKADPLDRATLHER